MSAKCMVYALTRRPTHNVFVNEKYFFKSHRINIFSV